MVDAKEQLEECIGAHAPSNGSEAAHLLLAGWKSESALQTIRRELQDSPLGLAGEEYFSVGSLWPCAACPSQAHRGQFSSILAMAVGPEYLLAPDLTVDEVIEQEKTALSYQFIRHDGLKALGAAFHSIAQALDSRPIDLTRTSRARADLLLLQAQTSREDLSWQIEGIARQLRYRGMKFASTWTDRDGHQLRLADLIAFQLWLYELDAQHRIDIIPEYGVHLLLTLSRLPALFAGDRTYREHRAGHLRIIGRLVDDLLRRLDQEDIPREYRLSLKAHMLEYLADPACYKNWNPSLRRRGGAILGEVVALAVSCKAEPPKFGVAAHALRSLNLLQAGKWAAGCGSHVAPLLQVEVKVLKDSLSKQLRRQAWDLVAANRARWSGGKPRGAKSPPRLDGN